MVKRERILSIRHLTLSLRWVTHIYRSARLGTRNTSVQAAHIIWSVEIVYPTECGYNVLKVIYYRVNDTEGY